MGSYLPFFAWLQFIPLLRLNVLNLCCCFSRGEEIAAVGMGNMLPLPLLAEKGSCQCTRILCILEEDFCFSAAVRLKDCGSEGLHFHVRKQNLPSVLTAFDHVSFQHLHCVAGAI